MAKKLNNPPELEKYSLCTRINRKLAGRPLAIISISYMVLFLILTFIAWFLKIEITGLQQILYYLGVGLFIISIWIAFIGFLLRSIK